MVNSGAARLIGLDWGSTRLRAFLLGDGGAVLQTRQSDAGATTLQGADRFAQALAALVGDWRAAQPGLRLLACGMVGSQHGWHEAPYARCPADAAALARQLLQVDEHLGIVPGLLDDTGRPDVMRGEETQIVGALALHPGLADEALLVLPGTHSKWAQVQGGRVTGFATYLTGELFALLRQHSVLARLMPADGSSPASPEAFLRGVEAAREPGGLAAQLFGVRTLGLLRQLDAGQLPDYLSGLLIGHELLGGLRPGAPRLALVGDPALCARYARALTHLGQPEPLQLDNTAPAGLWALAHALDLP